MSETHVESKLEKSVEVAEVVSTNPPTGHPSPVADQSVVRNRTTEFSQPANEPPPSMMTEMVKYAVSFSILAAGVAIAFGLGMLREDPKDQPKDQLIPMVSMTEVDTFVGQLDMVVSGTVVPFREIRVAAEVSGNVIKKYPSCEAGNYVRKGEKLLEIDPQDYELQLATRQAELEQSQRMLAETQMELDGAKKSLTLAEKDFAIAQEEFDRNQRIKSALSSAEFDQSKRNLLNVETALTNRRNSLNLITTRLQRMESAIELSKSQLDRAQLNLQKAVIVAPDDGIIVSESIQEGEFVNMGTQLLTFEDTSRSEVICNLSPRDLEWIRDNSPIDPDALAKIKQNKVLAVYYLPKTAVSIYEPERQSIVWDGVLERFDGIGRDNRTRTIPTRITIREPVIETDGKPHALVRGMYVKCRIQVQVSEGDEEQKFVAFPEVALQPDNSVWVVDAENRLKRVPVVIVDRGRRAIENETQKIVILRLTSDSLRVGDRIVTSPIPTPVEGMEVKLKGDVQTSDVTSAVDPKDETSEDETSEDEPIENGTEDEASN
ncbi:MAG: HlyD family efflux transporter periplasmic adaptor subunit [Planctomycetota bacterium]